MLPIGNGPDTALLEKEIRRLLDEIKDPCSIAASVPMGLGEMGIVKEVRIAAEGQVTIELRLTSPFCEMISYMTNQALAKVGSLPGVTGVTVLHDSGLEWDHDMIAPEAQARRQRRLTMLHTLFTQQQHAAGAKVTSS
jgi:metal-sulfur cluster biosynthetic enzyme